MIVAPGCRLVHVLKGASDSSDERQICCTDFLTEGSCMARRRGSGSRLVAGAHTYSNYVRSSTPRVDSVGLIRGNIGWGSGM